MSSPTRQNTAGLKLLSSSRADFNLPSTTPFIHFETTDYFTPDGRDYPMPHNNVFVQVNASLKRYKIADRNSLQFGLTSYTAILFLFETRLALLEFLGECAVIRI